MRTFLEGRLQSESWRDSYRDAGWLSRAWLVRVLMGGHSSGRLASQAVLIAAEKVTLRFELEQRNFACGWSAKRVTTWLMLAVVHSVFLGLSKLLKLNQRKDVAKLEWRFSWRNRRVQDFCGLSHVGLRLAGHQAIHPWMLNIIGMDQQPTSERV